MISGIVGIVFIWLLTAIMGGWCTADFMPRPETRAKRIRFCLYVLGWPVTVVPKYLWRGVVAFVKGIHDGWKWIW